MKWSGKNITATEVRQREKDYWERHKKSKEYLARVEAEERLFLPILDKMLEIAKEHERKHSVP